MTLFRSLVLWFVLVLVVGLWLPALVLVTGADVEAVGCVTPGAVVPARPVAPGASGSGGLV